MPEMQTEADTVTHEITIDAPIEDVWEAVATEDGRDRWLEADEDRRLVVEQAEPPRRISWWWWQETDAEPARYVDVRIVSVPDGTRVTVTEARPSIVPVARLAASCQLQHA